MKNIAIIPIRSGSKGLPDKNVLFFNGTPLVCATIEALLSSGIVESENIFVSTDSHEYIALLKKFYPEVTYRIRSSNLASDQSSTGDFLEQFLTDFSKEDNFILCQATSPLRTGKQIRDAYDCFKKNNKDMVVSIAPVSEPESLNTRLGTDNKLIDIVGIDKKYRRQDKDQKFRPNGAIYIANVGDYLDNVSFFTENTIGFVMNQTTSVDIDGRIDFEIAEILADPNYRVKWYRRQILDEILPTLSSKTRVAILDGRNKGLYSHYLRTDFFTTSAFHLFGIFDVVSLLKKGYLASCKQLVVSVGLFDLSKNSVENVKEGFLEAIEICLNENIQVTFCNISPVLFSEKYSNKDISSLNYQVKSICENAHSSLIKFECKNHTDYSLDSLPVDGIYY